MKIFWRSEKSKIPLRNSGISTYEINKIFFLFNFELLKTFFLLSNILYFNPQENILEKVKSLKYP